MLFHVGEIFAINAKLWKITPKWKFLFTVWELFIVKNYSQVKISIYSMRTIYGGKASHTYWSIKSTVTPNVLAM